MKEVVIASIVRTPIGSFGGALKALSAVELGVAAAEEAIKRAGISKDSVDELIFGNVLQAGLGQNTARQISIKLGLPECVSSYAVNKLCGSGLKAVALAAQSIIAGDNEIVVAGGTESMSNTPYLLPNARWGIRMGDAPTVDSMVLDGLTDAFHNYHMGVTAENIAEEQGISREAQDEYAAQSQNRAEAAIKAGKFKDEIVPITIPQRKGDPIIVDTDEFPRFGLTAEKLSGLKPAFKRDGGTVTAGNASGINDGAAACVVMSKEKAEELGIKPLATIVAYASAGVSPKTMGYGPIAATQAVIKKSGISLSDIELIEANEAFAVQALAVCKELKLDSSIVNVNGGAIALGHPIGASGARVLTTLIYEMKKRNNKLGLATLCIGGGQGISMLVKM